MYEWRSAFFASAVRLFTVRGEATFAFELRSCVRLSKYIVGHQIASEPADRSDIAVTHEAITTDLHSARTTAQCRREVRLLPPGDSGFFIGGG